MALTFQSGMYDVSDCRKGTKNRHSLVEFYVALLVPDVHEDLVIS